MLCVLYSAAFSKYTSLSPSLPRDEQHASDRRASEHRGSARGAGARAGHKKHAVFGELVGVILVVLLVIIIGWVW